MSNRAYNAQFLTIDFRLLDCPRFNAFMRSPAFPVYLQLRRYVWRSSRVKHALPQVNELFAQGHLVAAVDRRQLAEKAGLAQENYVSKLLADLEAAGLVQRVKTGRESIYVLGRWEDRSVAGDGSFVIEIFFADQIYGPENLAQILVEGNSEDGAGADLYPERRSDLQKNVGQTYAPSVGLEPDLYPERRSDLQKNVGQTYAPSVGQKPDLRSQRRPDLRSQRRSDLLIDKRIEKDDDDHHLFGVQEETPIPSPRPKRGSRPKKITSHQAAVHRVQECLLGWGRKPPEPSAIAAWIKNLCGGNDAAVIECLNALGAQGHLRDKPDAYLFRALANHGRKAVQHEPFNPPDRASNRTREEDVVLVLTDEGCY
jgi:hypothetical protein